MKFRPFYTVIFGNIERNIREYHNNVEEQTEQRIPFNAYFIWNKKQMNNFTTESVIYWNWKQKTIEKVNYGKQVVLSAITTKINIYKSTKWIKNIKKY